MLILCQECDREISDKAFACPHCGCPSMVLAQHKYSKRAKTIRHKKLPNGFGSIKKLSGKRSKPYATYPPTAEFNLNGSPVPVPAVGYFETYNEAYAALVAYHDSNKTINLADSNITFAEVFQRYYDSKYNSNRKKQYSISSIRSTRSAFNNCQEIHNRKFIDLRKDDLQRVLDKCNLKHASLELIKSLYVQMYSYAISNDIIDKNYASFVTIDIADDDEHGEPFSDSELNLLWKNSSNDICQAILVMIYTGYRISAFNNLEVNFEEQYFRGGVKTESGKNRIVPFNHNIEPFISNVVNGPLFKRNASFRQYFFNPCLEELGIVTTANNKHHTPHDARHTFSWLCDKYKVDDTSKHKLMGHKVSGDVEKSVYSHRTIEELRFEINKIER